LTAANWIDRPDRLADFVERVRGAGAIGLDTEFVFERTFRPRLGLIQVAAGGEIALVDAVRLSRPGDLAPLAALLGDRSVRKLLHSGSGDVPILRRATGVAPRPLFDTQIAAAFLGMGSSISYAALVRELFGVELPKDETRTDWLRRPLSPEQLRYAAEDVAQLVEAAAELERRLLDLGRLEWALEDAATLVDNDREGIEPASAWRRVKGIDRLSPGPRAVARALAAWREVEADRLDLARSFLLRDETLLALARRDAAQPPTPAELTKMPGYDARRHGGHTASWVDALARAHAEVAAGTAPPEPEARRLSSRERERRERLDDAVAALVARRAGELGLPPELLLSRRQRERALAALEDRSALAGSIGGFRADILGEELERLATSPG
jgi:ribonuclease D